ncbi:hypothetical protein RIF23_07360 [Lipingzhangella sp. LS1_29]|uniref:Uncharacterized protein n=1 Tax=Lipingzhangella rawalii TaxID=2055835 RepID=A0ABU2H651_9ACTN|nr:hypothetical protein [Lipingzhangella rawalii]MDS1270109.1 hypothetical protein [Lipingzhangella rawalii]
MPEYEFVFIVEGLVEDDVAATRRLRAELGARVWRSGELCRLQVRWTGPDPVAAVGSFATHVAQVVSRVRLARLDRDLVRVADIASRVGVPVDTVAEWIASPNPEGEVFPQPEGDVAEERVWLWAEVNQWLAGFGLDDGRRRPSRADMAEIEWRLQRRKLTELTVRATPESGPNLAQVLERALRSPDFVDYLVSRDQVRDVNGRYTIVACAPDEAATTVFRRLRGARHPVVLAMTEGDVRAVEMTPISERPADVVELVREMTARDWFGLIRLSPGQSYGLREDSETGAMRADGMLDMTGQELDEGGLPAD